MDGMGCAGCGMVALICGDGALGGFMPAVRAAKLEDGTAGRGVQTYGVAIRGAGSGFVVRELIKGVPTRPPQVAQPVLQPAAPQPAIPRPALALQQGGNHA